MKTGCLLAVAALLTGLTGCGSSESRPGSVAVYDRIGSATSCADLQQEFDTAEANRSRAESGSEQADAAMAYMEAADDRMRELDCY